MPLFDFKCTHCDIIEEIFLRNEERELVVKCQACDREMEKQLCFPKGVKIKGATVMDGTAHKVEVIGTGYTKPNKEIGGQEFTKAKWE